MLLKVSIFQTCWMIFFCDAIWNNLSTNYTGIQSISGFLFSIMLQQLFQSNSLMVLTCNIYLVPSEKHIYYKERASGFYTLTPYFLAKNITTSYTQIIQPIIVALSVYWVVGLNDEPYKFLIFSKEYTALICILCNIVGGSVGLFFGTLFASTRIAMPVAPTVLSMFMLYAGFFSNTNSIIGALDWLKYLSVRSI
jgi:hypothetical protein